MLVLPAMANAQNLATLKQPVSDVISSSQDLGKVSNSTPIFLTVSLQPVNAAAMEAFATSLADPLSPNYGHFLTPTQIGAAYGQPESVVNSIVSYLKGKGLTVTMIAASNMAIRATGTAAQVDSAFNTSIHSYHTADPLSYATSDFYANSTVLKVPSSIAPNIQLVSGISNYSRKRPASILSPNAARSVYDVQPLYNTKFLGQGRTIGVTNFGGYALSNIPLFYSHFSLPTPTNGVGSNITVRTIDGGNTGDGGECDLDLEMELGEAPLANLVLYDSTDLVAALTEEANLNECDIISESWAWGIDAGTADTCHTLHVQMAIQGITYCCASGDWGTSFLAADSLTYPQVESYVLDIGGTTVTLDSTGLGRSSEVGWGGSGGGWVPTSRFTFNTLPGYQHGPGIPTTHPYRLVPDVSLHASGGDNGAYWFYYANALQNDADGTSFASPCFSGALLVAEQKLIQLGTLNASNKYRFGQIAPVLYSVLRSSKYSSVFYDVTSGSNGQLPDGTTSSAGANWDFVTGMGSIDIANFVQYETPPVPLSATTMAIYNSEGVESPAGQPVSQIISNDGRYLTVNSVSSSIGQVASPEYIFQYPSTTEPVDTLSVSTTAIVPKSATNFVYAFNKVTGLWDLIGASAGTGALATVSYQIANPSNYVASGTIKIVERALYPTRLGSVPFQLKVDSATVTVNAHSF